MKGMKRSVMAYMQRIMLSCEEATFIATKKIVQDVSLKERMNLQMHLAVCKHCRKFYHQVRMITGTIRHHSSKAGNSKAIQTRMSPAEKSKLQKLIYNQWYES
jgi:hypothetical protein